MHQPNIIFASTVFVYEYVNIIDVFIMRRTCFSTCLYPRKEQNQVDDYYEHDVLVVFPVDLELDLMHKK